MSNFESMVLHHTVSVYKKWNMQKNMMPIKLGMIAVELYILEHQIINLNHTCTMHSSFINHIRKVLLKSNCKFNQQNQE